MWCFEEREGNTHKLVKIWQFHDEVEAREARARLVDMCLYSGVEAGAQAHYYTQPEQDKQKNSPQRHNGEALSSDEEALLRRLYDFASPCFSRGLDERRFSIVEVELLKGLWQKRMAYYKPTYRSVYWLPSLLGREYLEKKPTEVIE